MQLLILFLFLIQFVFCSGVDLLQNPGQLTEHEKNIGKTIKPIEGLFKVVTDIMNLFASPIGVGRMPDRQIIERLDGNHESIQDSIEDQYNSLSIVLGHLNYKSDRIIEYINKNPTTELTLNTQQPIPELEQILINKNKYMKNIIILALNLIKGIINTYILIQNRGLISNQNPCVSSLDAFKNKLIEYIDSLQSNDIAVQNTLLNLKIQVFNFCNSELDKRINIIKNQIQSGNNGGNNVSGHRSSGRGSGSGRG